MIRRTKLRVALTVAAGIAFGLGVATAVPRTQAADTPPDRPFAKLPGVVEVGQPRARERGPREQGGILLRRKPGTLREVLRRPDPAGGPDWVMRSFVADRIVPEGMRRHGVSPVIGTSPCFQLGREVGGRFGWIDGENVFRPVATSSTGGAPNDCVSPTLLRRHDLEVQLTTLVGHPTTDDRAILGSVVWGTTGGPVPSLRLTAAGTTRTASQTDRSGAFLEFYGPGRSPADVRFEARWPGGKTTSRGLMSAPTPFPGRARPWPKFDPSTSRIIARAPDPGGGPSIGMRGVRAVDGTWCMADTGSIVGDRVGTIDADGGTMWELDASTLTSGCPTGKDRFPKDWVLNLGSSGGSSTDQPELDPARAALRLQPGRSLIYGIAREDVTLLTISTPRDVRSLVPTAPAHAFLVAYDGNFAAGDMSIVATLRDGTTRTMKQRLGF